MERCSKCGAPQIVNRKYMLCDNCNHFRLHGKTKLAAQIEKMANSPVRVHPIKTKKKRKKTLNEKSKVSQQVRKEKRSDVVRKDRETYFKVFSTKAHKCEECGAQLPDQFEDEDGRVIFPTQYSHILSKGAHNKFRHNPINFNRLCDVHHHQWEFGKREDMEIYESNQIIIQGLFKGETCGACRYFVSYQEDYFDMEEPDWCGFCKGNKDIDYTEIDKPICSEFEAKVK